MHGQFVQHFHLLEVPNDNIGVEARVSLLSTGDVPSAWTHSQTSDFVVVPSEEGLGSLDDVPYNDSRPERENNVFVFWMEQKSIGDIS